VGSRQKSREEEVASGQWAVKPVMISFFKYEQTNTKLQ